MINIRLDDKEGINKLLESMERNKGKNQKELVKQEFEGTKWDMSMEDICNRNYDEEWRNNK